MLQNNPVVSDLIVKERHKDMMRETETGRLLALASGEPRRNWTLYGRTRHLLGAALIHVGTWLQGARHAELPDLRPRETTSPASPQLS